MIWTQTLHESLEKNSRQMKEKKKTIVELQEEEKDHKGGRLRLTYEPCERGERKRERENRTEVRW
jgi:hypothetical protein